MGFLQTNPVPSSTASAIGPGRARRGRRALQSRATKRAADGGRHSPGRTLEPMAYASFADLLAAATIAGSLGEAVISLEVEESGASRDEVLARLEDSLSVMEDAVARGLAGEARSRSGVTGGDARLVSEKGPCIAGDAFSEAVAGALAVAEVNAAMGR